MSVFLKSGLGLVVVGVIGAATNLWAREAFPGRWGGPNIGGGMLQLLFYGATIVGVVLIVVGIVNLRKASDS